jgi:hypothetical protein
MLVRVAVCAAWFFAWPVCAGIDGTTLPLPGIAIAMAQEQTALAPLTAVPVEAQPFGIAAVPVTDGEILRKWMGMQSEIRADDQAKTRPLVRKRRDASWPSSMKAACLAVVPASA